MEIIQSKLRPLLLAERIAMLGGIAERSDEIRLKRAALLLRLMRLDEAEAELSALPHSRSATLLRCECLLLRDRPDMAAMAAKLLLPLIESEPTGPEQSQLLADYARAVAASGDHQTAREIAFGLIVTDSPNVSAAALLISLGLSCAEAEMMLTASEGWVGPRRLTALRGALLAIAGHVAEALDLAGFHHYFMRAPLPTPPGWADLSTFNAALVAEIRASPDLFYSAGRQPGRDLWRLQGLPLRGMKAVPDLLTAIAGEVTAYANRLGDDDQHPFVQERPNRTKIAAWAGIASAIGYEQWHTHDRAWASGVYYAAVAQAKPNGQSGAIAFGWPGGANAEAAQEGTILTSFHPAAGDLLLFPGWQHHRTYPLGNTEERVAIAFDIIAQ